MIIRILFLLGKSPVLLGTTGAWNNGGQGGPCTQTGTLVLLNPQTGVLIREIGPVGYTVYGLAWGPTSGRLYATTPPGDVSFHGLITINPHTGKGKPVNKKVVNFGLDGEGSPIHSINIDACGNMVGWYDEFGPDYDTYVRINQGTGVATEFPDTGIKTSLDGSLSASSTSCGLSTVPLERLTSSIPLMEQSWTPYFSRPARRLLAISTPRTTSTMGLTSTTRLLRLSSW